MAQNILLSRYSVYYQRATVLYQKPEIRASVEIILSVFAVAMLIFFAIRPTIINIFALQKNITDQEAVLKKAENKIGQLLKAEKQLSDFSDRLNLIDSAVPTGKSFFAFAKRVEIIALDSGIKIESYSFPSDHMSGITNLKQIDATKIKNLTKVGPNGLVEYKVNIKISGNQKTITSFLNRLENMDLLAFVKEFTISKDQKGTNQVAKELKADVTVLFYDLVLEAK